jgi:enediyne biosynthesis protein E4
VATPTGRLTIVIVGAIVALVGAALAWWVVTSGSAASGRPAALPAPRFVEEATAAGLVHVFAGDDRYIVGGGVATFDCDEDGLPDLYLAGGDGPSALFRNRSTIGGPLRFEDVTDTAVALDAVTGAYPLDVDGDRQTDLVVLRRGEEVLLRGLGECRFAADDTLGLDGGAGWTVAFSATWETPSATLPTLALGDYQELDAQGAWTGRCSDDRLLRPTADGASYGAPIALSPSFCTLSMLFSDWDRSGRRDLRVSNDRHYYREDGQEQLWRVEAGVAPRLYTRDDGWEPLRIWGMGIAAEDLTGDGFPEYYLTSQGDNKLQTLAAGPATPTYRDIALARGVTAHRPYTGDVTLGSTAWHPAFEDVNADGYPDLYVTKGNVEQELDYAIKDPSNLLIGQPDGTFVEGGEAAGIVEFEKARGAAVADLNGDGLPDIVQVVRRTNVRLWRNLGSGADATTSPMGHWLAVDLDQDAPNHDAIGAFVAVRAGVLQRERERTVGGGHASGQLVPLHFGLGAATRAEVRVTWPDGEVGPWLAADADRSVTVRRGASAVESAAP